MRATLPLLKKGMSFVSSKRNAERYIWVHAVLAGVFVSSTYKFIIANSPGGEMAGHVGALPVTVLLVQGLRLAIQMEEQSLVRPRSMQILCILAGPETPVADCITLKAFCCVIWPRGYSIQLMTFYSQKNLVVLGDLK
jgi:hypothetical protein